MTKTKVELTQAECWEVLRTARVGRVLYTRHAMPLAHPVPFLLYRGLIVFSLDPVTAARIVRLGHDVGAFQVDDLADCGVAARSVTVHGELGLLEPGQVATVEGCGLPAHGGEAVYAYIVPELVAGSRLPPFAGCACQLDPDLTTAVAAAVAQVEVPELGTRDGGAVPDAVTGPDPRAPARDDRLRPVKVML